MRRIVLAKIAAVLVLYSCACCPADEQEPIAWWQFDEPAGDKTAESIRRTEDAIVGNFEYAEGVKGKAIRFDGCTTGVVRKADDAPKLSDAFTIEAWVALQALPWNNTAIISQELIEEPEQKTREPVAEEGEFIPGLVGARYRSPNLTDIDGPDVLTDPTNDWTGGANDWSAKWSGYIEAPFTGEVTVDAEADDGLKLQIGGRVVIDGWGKDKARAGTIQMEKGKRVPVELWYYQDGGDSYLKLFWSWEAHRRSKIPDRALWHDKAQHERIDKDMLATPATHETSPYLFFGIDAYGHLALKLNLQGRTHECVTSQTLPMLKWTHVAATFSKDKTAALYIDGKQAARLEAQGTLAVGRLSDLFLGQSHRKMYPVGTEREPSKRLLSKMVLDGLLDEVKIYDRALAAQEIAQSSAEVELNTAQPLHSPKFPSGPKDLPKQFMAYYTRLNYTDQWERPWRIGPHPDILVTFDLSPVRLAFWRGTNYGASWVAENGIWMGDQSLEDGGTGWGCCEHMSDKQCRYSHVRLIENHDARIVVHWRYAVCDIRYTINHTNPVTNWGDWADEYYCIYPDAVAVRKQVLHSDRPGGFQWQETIFFSQPGTRPEDNIELDAFTLANMDGESHTYTWANGSPHSYPLPKGANIQMTNLKAKYKPFIIFEPDPRIAAFGGGHKLSKFPWWNHWPVAQLPNDGRQVCGPDRPASSSLSNYKPRAVKGQGNFRIAVSLYGMTDKPIESLAGLARSWNNPAQLKVLSGNFESKGYDGSQRAYVLAAKERGTLRFELDASRESPVVNPALVVTNWGDWDAELKLSGKKLKRGSNFRLGHNRTLDRTNLVVWIKAESMQPLEFSLAPTER